MKHCGLARCESDLPPDWSDSRAHNTALAPPYANTNSRRTTKGCTPARDASDFPGPAFGIAHPDFAKPAWACQPLWFTWLCVVFPIASV